MGFTAKTPDMGKFIYFEFPDADVTLIIDTDIGLPEDYMRAKLKEIGLPFGIFDTMYKAKK